MKDFLSNVYHNLLCINGSNINTHLDLEPKRQLLKVCLYLTFIMLFFFSTLHAFVYHDISNELFILELATSLAALYGIISLQKNQSLSNTNKIAKASTIVFGLFLLFFVTLNQNESFGLVWLLFFPIFAMIINGPKRGLRYTFVFLVALFIMAYNNIGHWQNGLWDEMSFIRLTLAFLILTFIIYINEVSLINVKHRAKLAMEALENLSSIDELTKISNRRHINKALNDAIQISNRHEAPLIVTLFDIDDFKKVNDQYGHIIGDKVLFEMSNQLSKIIRSTDSFGRWGGEEFLIVLPHETLDSAIQFCEKLRQCIQNITFSDCPVQITCSFGVAQFQKGMTAEQIVEQADKALYRAKASGKNKVLIYTPE